MKKRTVITTEKREVWVIKESGGPVETDEVPQTDDTSKPSNSLAKIERRPSGNPAPEEEE